MSVASTVLLELYRMITSSLLELYRMITSSLLILFIPQSCGGQLYTMSQNIKWNPNHHFYNSGLILNYITLFTFSSLYFIELRRENKLIDNLDVNPKIPNSNDDVDKIL